jgi:hypothetical protein
MAAWPGVLCVSERGETTWTPLVWRGRFSGCRFLGVVVEVYMVDGAAAGEAGRYEA